MRRYPQILAYGALHFALALGVLVGVLALLGRLDLVDDLMGIPVVYGGTRGGAMVQRLRVDSRRSSR